MQEIRWSRAPQYWQQCHADATIKHVFSFLFVVHHHQLYITYQHWANELMRLSFVFCGRVWFPPQNRREISRNIFPLRYVLCLTSHFRANKFSLYTAFSHSFQRNGVDLRINVEFIIRICHHVPTQASKRRFFSGLQHNSPQMISIRLLSIVSCKYYHMQMLSYS